MYFCLQKKIRQVICQLSPLNPMSLLPQRPWRCAKDSTRGGQGHEAPVPAALCRRWLPGRDPGPGPDGGLRYQKGLDVAASLAEDRSAAASALLLNSSHPPVDHRSCLLGTSAQVAGPHCPGRTGV